MGGVLKGTDKPRLVILVAVASLLASALVLVAPAASPASSQDRTTSQDTTFFPDVTIRVPAYDDDRNGANDFADTEFTVNFTPTPAVAGRGCTASASETWQVNDAGVVTRQSNNGVAATLVDRPAGATIRCEYAVEFPPAAGVLALEQDSSTDPAVVKADSLAVAAVYELSQTTTFVPDINITVPEVDEDGDRKNDLSGISLTVFYSRTSGSPSGCPFTKEETWKVNDDGTVTRADPSATVMLESRIKDEGNLCRYTVRFSHRGSARPQFVRSTLPQFFTQEINISDPTASVSYRSEFGPSELTIRFGDVDADRNGRHDSAGTMFQVRYSRVDRMDSEGNLLTSECTEEATHQLMINSFGEVSGLTAVPLLVDRSPGETVRCEYDVTLPDRIAVLRRASETSVTIDTTTTEILVDYVTKLQPDIRITVPDMNIEVPDDDGNNVPVNVFAGTEIVVGFSPTASTYAGCTSRDNEVWVVGADGAVTRQGDVAMLVDFPIGVFVVQNRVGCFYNVLFPTSVVAAAGVLTLNTASSITISSIDAEAMEARATYARSESLFSPDITIMVPAVDALAGTEIVVGFVPVANSHSDCPTGASETWVVGTGGSVTRQSNGGVAAVLVNVPAGETSRCEYDVRFPTPVAVAVGALTLTSGGSATVSSAAKEAAASYESTASMFSPAITIEVPDIDDDDGNNVFAEAEISVSYTVMAGSPAGCTIRDNGVWVVGAGGVVERRGDATVLVDRPAGQTSRCEYVVGFPSTVTAVTASAEVMTLASTTPVTVSFTAKEATASYVNTFSPEITIMVPDIDDDDGDNVFAETTFMVSFAPVDGSHAGCLADVVEVWVVGAGGVATRQGGAALLVDRPRDVASDCKYVVEFPTPVATAVGALTLASTTPATVSFTAKGAAASYENTDSVFSPGVLFTFPDVDDNNDGVNDFAGTNIEVTFTRTAGSHAGCSATATETWRVADSGTLTQQGAAAELVGRPAGQTQGCAYDVSAVLAVANSDLEQVSITPATVTAAASTVTVEYTTTTGTMFSPGVMFTFPDVDDDNDGVNDFAGTRVTVIFTATAGSPAGCSATATETWRVADSGTLTQQGAAAELVGRPRRTNPKLRL